MTAPRQAGPPAASAGPSAASAGSSAASAGSEPSGDQAAVDHLLELFDLADLGDGAFRGDSPQIGWQRVFGGQVACQALVAAGRTVAPERLVHSLHGYFVRAGDPAVPIIYRVEDIRDGRSFSVRRSVAYQHDLPIFFMSASFHRAEEGLDHQAPPPTPVPPPEAVPTMAERLAQYPERLAEWNRVQRPIEVRYVTEPGFVAPGNRRPQEWQLVWMRMGGKLPDDPLVHACALTYASDLSLLDAVLAHHGEVWGPGGFAGASLDHALWLHRPFRADEWFLYDCYSPSASGGRGLATGRMFTADGRHIATVVQEGLLRRIGGPIS